MDSQLLEFIKRSQNELEKIQTDLELIKYEIFRFIEENVLQKVNLKHVMIQGRVKGTTSLKEKIYRKNYFTEYEDEVTFINNLPDLIGLRLVCLLEKEEKDLFSEIDKLFSSDDGDNFSIIPETEGVMPYLRINKLNQPEKQKNGHEIFKLKCQWVTTNKSINIEVQLKSLVHMFWGEIEHALFYKNYAYTVGANFYKNFMESTREILHTVDYQLEIIQEQLTLKDEDEQIEEIIQMVTRILYNSYHPKLVEIIGCDIDLKEVYEVVVSMYFININEKDIAFNKTNEIISTLNSQTGQLNYSHFNFGNYNTNRSRISPELKEFAKLIDELIRGTDVFWKALFAIYGLIFKPSDHTKAINSLADNFMSFYEGFSDEFDEGLTKVTECIIQGIRFGIVTAFKKYRKIDFFVKSIHQVNIFGNIINFIRDYIDELSGIDESELLGNAEEKLSEFISILIDLRIGTLIRKSITFEELTLFHEWVNKQDLIWIPPNLNIEQLNKKIRDHKSISGKDFNNLFLESR